MEMDIYTYVSCTVSTPMKNEVCHELKFYSKNKKLELCRAKGAIILFNLRR